jgi:hypothetical protein
MLKRLVDAVTLVALCSAVVCSALWWWFVVHDRVHNSPYEAASATCALIAAGTGIPAERWAAARERRRTAIGAIERELVDNAAMLRLNFDSARQVGRRFSRVRLAAVDSAYASGVLSTKRDIELLSQINAWYDEAQRFNQGLGIVETYVYTFPNPDAATTAKYLGPLYDPDGPRARLLVSLDALSIALRAEQGRRPWPGTRTAATRS